MRTDRRAALALTASSIALGAGVGPATASPVPEAGGPALPSLGTPKTPALSTPVEITPTAEPPAPSALALPAPTPAAPSVTAPAQPRIRDIVPSAPEAPALPALPKIELPALPPGPRSIDTCLETAPEALRRLGLSPPEERDGEEPREDEEEAADAAASEEGGDDPEDEGEGAHPEQDEDPGEEEDDSQDAGLPGPGDLTRRVDPCAMSLAVAERMMIRRKRPPRGRSLAGPVARLVPPAPPTPATPAGSAPARENAWEPRRLESASATTTPLGGDGLLLAGLLTLAFALALAARRLAARG